MGTANLQSQLWGARARDWAEVQEGVAAPLFEAVLNKTAVGAKTSVLDIGCGSGSFCEMAAKRGARVSGIDAAEPLLAIARERVGQGNFRTGEMEELP
jgi:2-polyprenyl-3-methyl-5-hydroxy-6-metoxy-1,4-benzoquinol methylase